MNKFLESGLGIGNVFFWLLIVNFIRLRLAEVMPTTR